MEAASILIDIQRTDSTISADGDALDRLRYSRFNYPVYEDVFEEDMDMSNEPSSRSSPNGGEEEDDDEDDDEDEDEEDDGEIKVGWEGVGYDRNNFKNEKGNVVDGFSYDDQSKLERDFGSIKVKCDEMGSVA